MSLLDKTQRHDSDHVPAPTSSAKPHLFLVLECRRPTSRGARFALDGVDEIVIGRGAAREAAREADGGRTRLVVRVPDPMMSSTHARILRTPEGWRFEDAGSMNGSVVNGTRVDRALVGDDDLFALGTTLFVLRAALPTPSDAPRDADLATPSNRPRGFTTLLPAHAQSLDALAVIGASNVSVLLLGESGTGKEVLARALHVLSMRSGAFVPVNCGALPETLVESQLFGHAKGAFSGAVRDEPGFARAADKGTLFLDEIGDLPKTSQAALLRMLQEREVMPVGSTRAVKVDLRVVAATHQRVEGSDAFRSDLYARLAGFTHHLPPLRERREDIGLLVADLLLAIAPDRAADIRLTPECGRALYRYAWPLNVRELEHALRAAVVFATDGVIDVKHLPDAVRAGPVEPPSSGAVPRALGEDDVRTRDALVASLTEHRGNVSEVARSMGRTRMQIHRWMRRFAIDPETYRRA